ncbi:hypothetical protein J4434_05115 [Candidatus Woesearchaeota archaeon]|nr:hypothetical protein [Candidatus Woesearchaeota archaeon]
MDSLEKRLKELSDNKERIDFASELVDKLRDLTKGTFNCSYSYAQALDQLLSEAIDRHFTNELLDGWPKQTAILHSFYRFSLASARRVEGGHTYIAYPIRFLDRCYTLHSHRLDIEDSPQKEYAFPKLEVIGIVRDKRLYFGWHDTNSVGARHYDYNDFFFVPFIRNKLFQHSSGVAIRRADSHGKITMGGKRIRLGPDSSDQYIVVFFQREDTYLFNLSGEMLFETLNLDEVNEKRKINRMLDAKKKMNKEDETSLKELSDIVFQELKERWQKNPLQFKGWNSISYIIKGDIEATTSSDGTVILTNYQKKKRKKGIFVSKSHGHGKVRLEFKGLYVAAYEKDELVNCFKFYEPINYRRCLRSMDARGLDLVFLRTFDINDYISTAIGDSTYRFCVKKAIESYDKQRANVKHAGIIANTLADYFEILLIDNDNAFTCFPIRPCSKKPYIRVRDRNTT